MKLPISFPSFGRKQLEQNYYLILLLRDEKATAVILEEQDKVVRIKGINELHFSTPLENMTDDSLLDLLDKTISKAEETLPPSIQTELTVFGVKDAWVEEKKIKKEYLDRLKNVGKSLSLKPIGFLVISEAIAHLIQQEEGAPLSAIVAEVGKYSVMLSLFRGGKLLETKNGTLENSIPQTVDSLLKHFSSVEVLPSRLILLNADEDESLSQQFITHQWSKTLPFLHMPQISVLSDNFDARAAVQGAANQMSFTFTDSTIPLASSITSLTSFPKEAREKVEIADEKAEEIQPNKEISEENENKPQEVEEKDSSKENEEMLPTTVTAENFGFVQGKDIADLPFTPFSTPHNTTTTVSDSFSSDEPFSPTLSQTEISDEYSSSRLKQDRSNNVISLITGPLISFFNTLTNLVKNTPLRPISLAGKTKYILIAAVIFLLIVGIPLTYAYTAHANVTLIIKAKAFDDTEQVSFAVDGSNDFANNTIKTTTVSVSFDGKASVPASGKKEIGEKAKGTVTLYNNNESKKSLTAGTTITSSNNLDFTLDKDATISSASGDAFSGTKPGTTQVSVTAKAIGTESNLPSNTKFNVAGASNIAAKNDAAFSGGTKKEVTVVAKADHDKLLLQIPKDLENQAKDELGKKLSADEQLLPLELSSLVDQKEFDKNVGDEAKSVTATITVIFNSVSYTKTDLQDYAKAIIKQKVSSDAGTPESVINTGIGNIEADGDTAYTASITIKTGLLPQLDMKKIQQDITGKSVSSATEILKKLPQVESVNASVRPGIPLLSSYLPRKSANISILTTSHE